MKEFFKNNKVLILTVVAIVILIGVAVGTTYAYFVASLNGSQNVNNVVVTTQRIPNITINTYSSNSDSSSLPGWKGFTYATVTADAGDANAYYNLSITHNLLGDANSSQLAASNALAGYVNIKACQVASYDPSGYSAGTKTEYVTSDIVHYYIENATVPNPTCLSGTEYFTAISSSTMALNPTITFATNKVIAPSATHVYVVTYDFVNNGVQDDAQGGGFTTEWNASMGQAGEEEPIGTVTASMARYSNSTYTTCETLDCALDELSEKLG